MAYEVVWHTQVRKDLKAIPSEDAARIIAQVRTRLAEDPSGAGKPLSGGFKGLMRFRVGACPRALDEYASVAKECRKNAACDCL